MDKVVESIQELWPLIVAAAGALTWWITRADRREDRMIAELKEQRQRAEDRAAEAEKRADEAEAYAEKRIREVQADADGRVREIQAEANRWSRRASAWYGQLRDHGITPKPPWGEDA